MPKITGLGPRKRRLHTNIKRAHKHGQFRLIFTNGDAFGILFDRFIHQIMGCFHVRLFENLARPRSHHFGGLFCSRARSHDDGCWRILLRDFVVCRKNGGNRGRRGHGGGAKSLVGESRFDGETVGCGNWILRSHLFGSQRLGAVFGGATIGRGAVGEFGQRSNNLRVRQCDQTKIGGIARARACRRIRCFHFGGTFEKSREAEQAFGNRTRLLGVGIERSNRSTVEDFRSNLFGNFQSARELGAGCFDPPIRQLRIELLRRQIDTGV